MVQQPLARMCFGSASAETYPNVKADLEPFMQSVLFHLQGEGFNGSGGVLGTTNQDQIFSPELVTQFNKEMPIFIPSLGRC